MSEPKSPSLCGGAAGYNLAYLSVPGVRFTPTDQELIVHYLQRKLRGEPPLYAHAVNDDYIDVYSEHPKDLVRKLRKSFNGSWYVFSRRLRRYGKGGRPRRGTGDGVGFWKSTGAKANVHGGVGNKEVIGYKRGLTYNVFVDAPPGGAAKPKRKRTWKPTEWKMVEFVSANSDRPPDKTAANPMLLNDYVLCKITNQKSWLEVEGQDPSGLSQVTEEERGAPSDGNGASQVQHQSMPIEGLAGTQDGQQLQAAPEAPIKGDATAAAAALQQAEPIFDLLNWSTDFALGSNAHTLDDYGFPWNDTDLLLNWSTGHPNNTGMPSIFESGEYIKIADIAGESQPAEQQQATAEAKGNAATAAADTESLSQYTVAVPGDYDWEAWTSGAVCDFGFDDRIKPRE